LLPSINDLFDPSGVRPAPAKRKRKHSQRERRDEGHECLCEDLWVPQREPQNSDEQVFFAAAYGKTVMKSKHISSDVRGPKLTADGLGLSK